MKSSNIAIIIVLVTFISAGAGFFAGTKYQSSKTPNRFVQFQGQGLNRQRISNGNFRPVSGDIINVDDKSITVKLPDGSSKIIILSTNTVYLKSSSGTKEELKTGDKVMVTGNQNSDGSVTAQNIQINPPLRVNPENNKAK